MDTKIALSVEFTLGKERFRGVFYGADNKKQIGAAWIRKEGQTLALTELIGFAQLPGGSLPDIKITFSGISFLYDVSAGSFSFQLESEEFGKLALILDTGKEQYGLSFQMEKEFLLQTLPLIGRYLTDPDRLLVRQIGINYSPKDGITFAARIILDLFGFHEVIAVPSKDEPAENYEIENEFIAAAEQAPSITWVNVRKTLSALCLNRIGVAFKDMKIFIYLDAGFKISILDADFMELYLGAGLDGSELTYGLKGVYLRAAAGNFGLAGGLYADTGKKDAYSGLLMIRFEQFMAQAIAAYTKTDSGNHSVFAFLFIGFPAIGTPAFRVSGICAGAGFNRMLLFPSVDKIREFPLIRAVSGEESSPIRKESTPGEVLSELSSWIRDGDDSYFITAGIRFNLFAMINGCALLTVELGTRERISVLASAQLSVPAQAEVPNVFIGLDAEAVLDLQEGTFFLQAALCGNSYLFNKDCKLSGGFAFVTWFGKEHHGEFVLTIGGYHSKFTPPAYYPEVARVGINWEISSNLSLTGNAYFALTPVSIMAGGELKLLYGLGTLKAWLKAETDFLIQWKPYHYDILVSVFVGASYRLDFLLIHKTFSLELGAELHLWGPEFSGYLHIKWYIISFTVRFGGDSPNQPEPVSWEEFNASFLRETQTKAAGSTQRDGRITLKPELGVIRKVGEEADPAYLVDDRLRMTLCCAVPCQSIHLGMDEPGKSAGVREAARCDTPLGILPMGITGFDSDIQLWIMKDGAALPQALFGCFEAEPVTDAVPKALWSPEAIGEEAMNGASMLEGILTGVTITVKDIGEPPNCCPPEGAYAFDTLRDLELITAEQGFCFT